MSNAINLSNCKECKFYDSATCKTCSRKYEDKFTKRPTDLELLESLQSNLLDAITRNDRLGGLKAIGYVADLQLKFDALTNLIKKFKKLEEQQVECVKEDPEKLYNTCETCYHNNHPYLLAQDPSYPCCVCTDFDRWKEDKEV